MLGRSFGAFVALGALVALGACGTPPSHGDINRRADAGDVARDVSNEFADVPFESSWWPSLSVLDVRPGRGPFTGGTLAVVRGTAFADGATVTIGGRQATGVRLIDSHRLEVLTPAGSVGPADVTVTIGGESATLADGFAYDAIEVSPPAGSIAGGTYVTITGIATAFTGASNALFGGRPATGVVVESDTVLHAYTPRGDRGSADVVVAGASNRWEALGGFEYFDTTDPAAGGLGGGPIAGTLNVTVIDWAAFVPVAGAFVVVGTDLSTPFQGVTDDRGQITFSDPALGGPIDLTVAKAGYESSTFVLFDARNVTLFLIPQPVPSPPPTGGGIGYEPAHIEGELRFGGVEFGIGPWTIVPDPISPDERKVAYVATSRPDIWRGNPYPGEGARVTEEVVGERGYPYAINARAGALAVFAVAGLENGATGEFRAYAMGVRRGVLTGPNETVLGQDIEIVIPLDHETEVDLTDLPSGGTTGPDRWSVESYVDLGGEGVLFRPEWAVRNVLGDRPFLFAAQPPLVDTIADATVRILAGWWTGEYESYPYSFRVRSGVRDTSLPLGIGDFLGVPAPVDPPYGGVITGHRLEWTPAAGAVASFHVVTLETLDAIPVWRMVVNGQTNTVTLPDLHGLPGLSSTEPRDFLYLTVSSVHVPSLDFDTWTYRHLRSRYWDAGANDTFLARFP